MINSISPATKSEQGTPGPGGGLLLSQYTGYLEECREQPGWRAVADREMDFIDGNQLDSVLLRRLKDVGIPPAIENLMGPAIDAVCGYEAKTRSDFRVSADATDDKEGEETAKALNYRLNQAERQSAADQACSEAFRHQVSIGLGWVEVAKETNPFLFRSRCQFVHRNEIWWDWLAKRADLRDARYLVRRRWTDVEQAALKFPGKKDLIELFGRNRALDEFEGLDGGTSTDLSRSYLDDRGWSVEEMEWRDILRGRVCLFEVWYRTWESIVVIKTPDGRVVEAQMTPLHIALLASGLVTPERTVVPRMNVAFWMGPHKLADSKSPYRHQDFPYVPFWGKREDRTGVPYGLARGMMYLQESVNSAMAKIRWGLAASRVERTKGAVADMNDQQFRQMVARPDADIVLDADHMTKQGARFEVKRDFQLNEQQYKMLGDSRLGIQRSSGITAGFQGQQGTARSGVQESTQIEQTTQQLADLMDNFKFARAKVGELLLSMEIDDLIGKPTTVIIPGTPLKKERRIDLNQKKMDPAVGIEYMTNDVERIRMKVAVSDVPSTPSFRAQQLQALSETVKSLPPDLQVVVLPHLLNLADVPDKEEIIQSIVEARGHETPEQIQKRIDEAIQRALKDAQYDLKSRELDMKYSPEKQAAEIAKLVSETVLTTVQAAFSSMQAAGQIAMNPAIAPVADKIMQAGGYQPPNPAGVDPDFPVPAQAVPAPVGLTVAGDTTPSTPAGPMQPLSPTSGAAKGIETMRMETT